MFMGKPPGFIWMEIDMTNLETLADIYGSLKAEMEALEKRLDAVKKEIRDTGVEELEGSIYTVKVGLSERVTLDQKKVKSMLTAAQLAEATSVSLITTLRVKATISVAA